MFPFIVVSHGPTQLLRAAMLPICSRRQSRAAAGPPVRRLLMPLAIAARAAVEAAGLRVCVGPCIAKNQHAEAERVRDRVDADLLRRRAKIRDALIDPAELTRRAGFQRRDRAGRSDDARGADEYRAI